MGQDPLFQMHFFYSCHSYTDQIFVNVSHTFESDTRTIHAFMPSFKSPMMDDNEERKKIGKNTVKLL